MGTEVGTIAEALRVGVEPPSPLQVQLDSLGRRLAVLGGLAVTVYTVLALLRGEALSDLAFASRGAGGGSKFRKACRQSSR
jgi:Ca2+-transporting ATPase